MVDRIELEGLLEIYNRIQKKKQIQRLNFLELKIEVIFKI